MYRLSDSFPNSCARQEPPSAVARRTRLRAQSPDPFGATLSPGEGIDFVSCVIYTKKKKCVPFAARIFCFNYIFSGASKPRMSRQLSSRRLARPIRAM